MPAVFNGCSIHLGDIMNRPRMTNLRTVRSTALVSLGVLSTALFTALAPGTAAADELAHRGPGLFFRALGGPPGDMLVRWQADCAKDANGIYAKTTALAPILQLDATQQDALNAYLAYVCTLPMRSVDDPATLETDARLYLVAQHMESEAQKLRLQAEQFRKFVNTLSVAQQLIFREQLAGRPPF